MKIQIFRFLRLILGGDILRPSIFLNVENRLQRSKLSPKAGTTGWTSHHLSRFAGEHEPDALSAGIFATGHRCATPPNSESIQAGFKQAPPKAVSSYQKRKASNLIQRFNDHLTVAGVDLHCPLPGMAYDLRGNINANMRYRYTLRQCRLTAPDELQILFVRRFIAFPKLCRHHLAGFTDVVDHRRVAVVLFIRELSCALVRFDHRSVYAKVIFLRL